MPRSWHGERSPRVAHETDRNKVATDIKSRSLIGHFQAQMIVAGFTNVTVTGFRGYYGPAENGPTLSTKNTKNAPIEDGTVTIDDEGTVHFDLGALRKIKGEKELNDASA